MTRDEIKSKFPNASASFIRANADFDNQAPCAIAQPAFRHEPLAAAAREGGDTGRVQVRVCSFRRRLIDPDNLCAKFFIDCLRYGGFIVDDTAADVSIEVTQRKVQFKWDERTEITIK